MRLGAWSTYQEPDFSDVLISQELILWGVVLLLLNYWTTNDNAAYAFGVAGAEMYTTLSPCAMCAGAVLLYGTPRVMVGEHDTFLGDEELLRSRGVEVVADDPACRKLMETFIARRPDVWHEHIGEG